MARLGVNIESIAALRELGRYAEPDPVTAAIYAEVGGCDGIVCPLRDELKPLKERDVHLLKEMVKSHLNLQIPPTEKMVTLALSVSPDMITLVPGKKPGSTPGGGLDILGHEKTLAQVVQDIRSQEIVVSLLVEPIIQQVKSAAKIGADYIELHLGGYAGATDMNERSDQMENITSVALAASKIGLGVAAGHGLNFQNIVDIVAVSKIEEINVGQALLSRALWMGIEAAVRDMVALVH